MASVIRQNGDVIYSAGLRGNGFQIKGRNLLVLPDAGPIRPATQTEAELYMACVDHGIS